ncbi:hypothetical protein D3C73_1300560 [compost metagenome]
MGEQLVQRLFQIPGCPQRFFHGIYPVLHGFFINLPGGVGLLADRGNPAFFELDYHSACKPFIDHFRQLVMKFNQAEQGLDVKFNPIILADSAYAEVKMNGGRQDQYEDQQQQG